MHEELWLGYMFAWGEPDRALKARFQLAVEEIVPFLRPLAVNAGFLLSLGKEWQLDGFCNQSVQQCFGVTDETARRLERMYNAIERGGVFKSRQFIGVDIEKLDALGEEVERRDHAGDPELSPQEWFDRVQEFIRGAKKPPAGCYCLG
jgi:hypothetical protein